MARPENAGPPELYYDQTEVERYTHNSRIVTIQAEMTERAVQLLEIDNPETSLLLDIGCGSGISGEVLTDLGFSWIGLDISAPMLAKAKKFTEIEEDLLLADMGAGLPFVPGVFDGAVSISAIQWLCHANRSDELPMRRLAVFFQTLFSCMASGARAVLQFYPSDSKQADLICEQAKRAGFNGGIVVDYPQSQKNKKFYLVAVTSGIQRLPSALTAEDDVKSKTHVDNTGRRVFNIGKKVEKHLIPGTREWVEHKKERQRNRGKTTKHSSKYTGRRRNRW